MTIEEQNRLYYKTFITKLAKKHNQFTEEFAQKLETMNDGELCAERHRLMFVDSIRCPVKQEIIPIGYGKKYGGQTLVWRFKKDPETKKRQGNIFERDGKRYFSWQQWSVIMPEGF